MNHKRAIKHYSKSCASCGIPLLSYKEKAITLLKPRSKGGKVKLSNAVCCCIKCNKEKADKDLKEWLSDKVRKHWFIIYLRDMQGFPKPNYTSLLFQRVRAV